MIGVAKVFESGQSKSMTIVIPKDIAREMKLRAGDRLLLELRDGELRIRKVE